jgi:glycosyltransferase involved in cell wall biosynthesis
LADVVIANSEFTKKSYADAGLDVNKVKVIPYGAPPICPEAREGGSNNNEPVDFLWAGTFSIRKGAHYLLSAWTKLNVKSQARFKVYGAMGLPSSLLADIPDSIEFSGTIPRSELYSQYHQADILVFPTLCDGFGMVVTEAFAQGLPVITTDRAGAADLVRHGENGLIIPAGNAEALAEALAWCIDNRQQLKTMRKAALKTAANWQWSDYRRALIDNLQDGLQVADYSL